MFRITTPLILVCFLLFNIGSYAQLPDGQNPGGKSWADSFQANGLCWCDSTFDHDLNDINQVSFTINGVKRNIEDICDELKNHPLVRDYQSGDPIYNDIQCGNGPANTAIDETQCPGRVDLGRDGCSEIGPRWDIEWLASRERFGGDGETESESNFVPDTNKVYYIDSAHHNVRLAATGESEDAFTTSLNNTGSNVEWKFVPKGNGSWHIQLAAGGSKPRLRTDNSSNADMQATTNTGTFTYYDITKGDIANSYFLTLAAGPADYNRLQINNNKNVKMVPSATHNGTWESFRITEAGIINENTTFSRLEAEDYDAMSGIQTEESSEGTDNVGWINNTDWIKFDSIDLTGAQSIDARVASRYSGGDIEVRLGSATGALLGTITIINTGGNQVYKTTSTNLSSVSGVQDVYLVFKGGNGYLFNINWIEFSSSSKSSKDIASANGPEITAYPNPVLNNLTIENAASGMLRVYDISGALVLSSEIASNKEVINVEGLTNGIYYFQINHEEELTILKIVK